MNTLKPPLICRGYSTNEGCQRQNCPDLHICFHFIRDSCKFSPCKRKHAFSGEELFRLSKCGFVVSPENAVKEFKEYMKRSQVERARDPSGARPKEQNSGGATELPGICTFYNVNSGCTKDEACPFVHICKHFVQGECKFNPCKRNHHVTEKDKRLLTERGLKPKDESVLLLCLKNNLSSDDNTKLPPSRPPSVKPGLSRNVETQNPARKKMDSTSTYSTGDTPKAKDVKSDAICDFYLEDRCRFHSDCTKIHPTNKRQFVWQYKGFGNENWIELPPGESTKVETQFASPSNKYFKVNISDTEYSGDFATMTLTGSPVEIRRCESSGKFATEWLWHWHDAVANKWVVYGELHQNKTTSIDSKQLEEKYCECLADNKKMEIEYHVNGNTGYSITLIPNVTLFANVNPNKSNGYVFRRPKMLVSEIKSPFASDTTNDPSKDVICVDFLTGKCSVNKCPLIHSHTSFIWQLLKPGEEWRSFERDSNGQIEGCFSDPRIVEVEVKDQSCKLIIEFSEDSYKVKGEPTWKLRRLESTGKLATKWLWYWEENSVVNNREAKFDYLSFLWTYPDNIHERWILFGKMGADNVATSVKSKDIEVMYQKHGSGKVYKVSTERFDYTIDLSKFEQTNSQTGKIRRLRRRPSADNSNLKFSVLNVPGHWGSSDGFCSQKLNKSGHEYLKIKSGISKLIALKSIKIYRIENHELWNIYNIRKQKMSEALGGNLNEMTLYHGTTKEASDKIMRENFDWRLAGTSVGTAYGHGCYFSPKFAISLRYCKEEGDEKYLFIASVLAGESTVGLSSYKRPPLKPNGELFDSCVDRVDDTNFHIVFDRNQIYPLYLLVLKTA